MMDYLWQEIVVGCLLAVAAGVVVVSLIGSWRMVKSGKCGGCASCASPPEPTEEAERTQRVLFLPAESLRNSSRDRKQS